MTASEVTLSDWLEFESSCRDIEAWHECVKSQPESRRKQIMLTSSFYEKANKWAQFFGIRFDSVDECMNAYQAFLSFEPEAISLPVIEDMKAGQLIDSKMMLAAHGEASQWEFARLLLIIFHFAPYNSKHLEELSSIYADAGKVTIDKCAYILAWYERLSIEICERYTLFHDSGEEEQPHMKAHMQRWGWINFIISIAKTKVFDIPGGGKNSIECVRESSLDDILIWASQEKDYNIAVMRDME